MKAKQPGQRRRVRRGTAERERLIQEQAASGLTKRAFCEGRQINLTTFYAWAKRKSAVGVQTRGFAQVEIAAGLQAAVEVLLPNGARIGIRHQGQRNELIALIRGVAGYEGGAGC